MYLGGGVIAVGNTNCQALHTTDQNCHRYIMPQEQTITDGHMISISWDFYLNKFDRHFINNYFGIALLVIQYEYSGFVRSRDPGHLT